MLSPFPSKFMCTPNTHVVETKWKFDVASNIPVAPQNFHANSCLCLLLSARFPGFSACCCPCGPCLTHSLEDVAWAFRKANQKTGAECAQGDGCETCYQAWSLHFNHLDWTTFCGRANDEADVIKDAIDEAKKHTMQPNLPKRWKPQFVNHQHSCIVEISRVFQVLSMGELKKTLKVQRVAKDIIANVPAISVMSESGEPETLYLFKHPDHEFRQCHLKLQDSQALQTEHLNQAQQSWSMQASDTFQHKCHTSLETSGMHTVINKNTLLTLQEILEKASNHKQSKESVQELDEADDDDAEDENEELIGAAAAAATEVAAAITPASKKPRLVTTPAAAQSLASKGSRESLSVHGQSMDDDAVAIADLGRAPSEVAQSLLSFATGTNAEGDLAAWKAKLPLQEVLYESGEIDGRRLDAFKRFINRAEQKGSLDAPLLRNYLKQVEIAMTLTKANFSTYTWDELQAMLQLMEVERKTLPPCIRVKVVETYAAQKLQPIHPSTMEQGET
eukprot:6486014-Amphidinium_carterae.2